MLPLLLSLGLASAEEPAANPWTLTPVVQVRPRLELDTLRDGTADSGEWFVSQRARVGVAAEAPHYLARVVVQDVRTWGSEADTLKDPVADAMDVHEAWARYRSGDGFNVTVGRQELAFDEQRLVGAVDWTQQGRSFDAVRLWGRTGPWNGEVSAAMLTEGALAGTGKDKDKLAILLRAGWDPRKEQRPGVVDLVSITESDAANEQLRETLGLYASGSTGLLSGRVEGYAQLGSLGDSDYSSWMAGVQGTIAPKVGGKPKFTLWFDNLTGDDDLTDSKLKTFQSPFGTNHKFYGTMDVMCFTEGCWADGRGLRDAALKIEVMPIPKVKLNVDGHAFMAAANQTSDQDSMLGQELDLWASSPIGKNVTLSGGASALMRPDLDPDMWAFVMFDVAP